MINLIVLFLLTIALFALLLNQQIIKNKKAFFTIAFVGWLAVSGVVFMQETVHQQIIESCKISGFPSQEIKLDDQKRNANSL
jgi:formate hydrogenlyase subunit 3/multisubunit Na+/H+ antiporter MnhD subunit